MADAAKLSSVKCMVRSVLQSVKEGVQPRNINRDYKEFAGKGIPYRDLGHGSLEEFIRSIPDVVAISRNSNGEVVYRAVADASTAHIAKLVSNQANRKKRKGGRGGMRRPAFHPKPMMSPRLHFPIHIRPLVPPHGWPNYQMPPQRRTVNRFVPRPVAAARTLVMANRGFGVYNTPQRQPRHPTPITAPKRRNIQESPGGSVKITVARTPSPVKPVKIQPEVVERVRGRHIIASEIPMVKQRVKQLVERRHNGLWEARLPFEYKETFDDEPPVNLLELIQQWPDIVIVDTTPGGNTLYSVSSPSPALSPPRPSRTFQTSTPSPVQQSSISPIRFPAAPPSPVSHVEPAMTIPNSTLPAVGSKPLILISHVADCSYFFVHLLDSAIADITQCLTDIYWRDEVRLVQNPVSGDYCAVEYEEDIWCRAQVFSVEEKDNDVECGISYIDFGNSDTVAMSKIRSLKKEVFAWPIQALKCRLNKVYSTKDDMEWDEATEQLTDHGDQGDKLQMHVIAHNEDTCVVELYTEEGRGESVNATLRELSLVLSYEKVTNPEPLEWPEEDDWEVVFSGIVSANQVVLRLVGDNYSERLSELEELIAKNSVVIEDFVPKVGDLCAAYDTSATNEGDVPWYRVRIASVQPDGVECEFVDYGGTVKLPSDKVRPLLKEEAALPFQAMPSYLTGMERCEANTKVQEKLKPWLGKTIIASVDNRDGVPAVTLWDTSTDEDVKINQVIADVIDLIDLEPVLPEDEGMCEGFLCHIDVDGTVYLQIKGPGLPELEALVQDVMKIYAKAGAERFVKDTSVGKLVMTLYQDGGWYRAVIKENLPGRKVAVFMVDYGNTEVVACSSLRELETANKKLYSLPYQAVPATLDLLNDKIWVPRIVERLGELAPEANIHVKTISPATQDAPVVVHLYQPVTKGSSEFVSINDQLLDPALWEEPKEEEEGATTEANPEGELTTEATSLLLAETEDLLLELSMTSTYSDLSGSHGDEDPAASADVATATGTPARLDMGVWNPEPFSPTTPGGAGDAAADQAGAGNKLHLSCDRNLDLNSNTLSGTLKLSSASGSDDCGDGEQARGAADHQMPQRPPSPKSGCSMHIMWVSDPSNFTCVRSEEIETINELMTQLTLFYEERSDDLTVDTVGMGELYGGYYEGRWYRIIVKSIINQPLLHESIMVSAHLVDYGNFGLLPQSGVRRLPTQFRTYPFQGIMAKLAGIEPRDGGWSEEVVCRFEDLVLQRTVTAWILGTDENGRVAMTLVDNDDSEGEAMMIHRKLLEEGLAVCTSADVSHSA